MSHPYPHPDTSPFHPQARPGPVPQIVTLNDGTECTSDDLRWRQESLSRHNHVQALRWLALEGRREYFSNVRHREGELAETRLKAAYARDWETRHAAEVAARAELARADQVRMP